MPRAFFCLPKFWSYQFSLVIFFYGILPLTMYTIYILKCADNSLYTGIAKNLEKRLLSHRSGTGSRYVRARLPVEVVYTKKCKNRSIATKREIEIKKMPRAKKLKLIEIS